MADNDQRFSGCETLRLVEIEVTDGSMIKQKLKNGRDNESAKSHVMTKYQQLMKYYCVE